MKEEYQTPEQKKIAREKMREYKRLHAREYYREHREEILAKRRTEEGRKKRRDYARKRYRNDDAYRLKVITQVVERKKRIQNEANRCDA